MSTTSRPRMKSQAVRDKCQVEIVDLKGSYICSPGIKWAAILDGTELCRVEDFAARHFRRSGFEATFLHKRAISRVVWCVFLVGDSRSLRPSSPNCRYFGSPCLRSEPTQRGDMDTTPVRLWDSELLTPRSQAHHQSSVSHRGNEGRATWTV